MVEEISERTKLEADLHSSEANIPALINNIEDAIWSIDKQYRLVSFNAAYSRGIEELTGGRPRVDDIVTEILPSEWREEDIALYNRALRGEKFVIERRYQYSHGEHYFEISYNPLIVNGVVGGAAVCSKDITERQRAHIALQQAMV